jgi:hypothetical protein
MNVLVRGVRFCLRVSRANCVKNILEPKADSTDAKEFFRLGDADPDRVRIIHTKYSTPESCLLDVPHTH